MGQVFITAKKTFHLRLPCLLLKYILINGQHYIKVIFSNGQYENDSIRKIKTADTNYNRIKD